MEDVWVGFVEPRDFFDVDVGREREGGGGEEEEEEEGEGVFSQGGSQGNNQSFKVACNR